MKKFEIKKWEELNTIEKLIGAGILIAIVLGVIQGLYSGIKDVFTHESYGEQIQEVTSRNSEDKDQKEIQRRFTRLSGIEKDKYSPSYGELVVEEINLWEGTGNNRGKVVGKVAHDSKVEIINEKNDEIMFYKVRTSDGIEGWVSEQFITEITNDNLVSEEDVYELTQAELLKKSNDESLIGETYLMTLYLEQMPTDLDVDFMSQPDANSLETALITCSMSSSDIKKLDGDSAQSRIYKPYKMEVAFTDENKDIDLMYSAECLLVE